MIEYETWDLTRVVEMSWAYHLLPESILFWYVIQVVTVFVCFLLIDTFFVLKTLYYFKPIVFLVNNLKYYF